MYSDRNLFISSVRSKSPLLLGAGEALATATETSATDTTDLLRMLAMMEMVATPPDTWLGTTSGKLLG